MQCPFDNFDHYLDTSAMQKFITPIPLSLYIHIPWCVRKCPYCDFNSHAVRNSIPEEAYVHALLTDFAEQSSSIAERPISSIFLGGGTPSLFSPNAIDSLLTHIQQQAQLTSDVEITLEANPGTVDQAHFIGFRQAGVNRLSLGIQSLQDEKLQALGRIHDREYALRAIDTAMAAGFDNFNLDLMHGLPNQSVEEALSDLKEALAFETPHVSWYQLTVEPNTFFHHQPPKLPEEDILWEIQEQGKQTLFNAHFHQYEVSAYAQAEKECRHNRNYWEFGDYLGIGAGAHSKLTDFEKQQVTRHWQVKNPKDYLDAHKKLTADKITLTDQALSFEFMLNALRLTHGVPISLFTERTGLSVDVIQAKVAVAKTKKLLSHDPNRLKATALGSRFLNDLVSLFL